MDRELFCSELHGNPSYVKKALVFVSELEGYLSRAGDQYILTLPGNLDLSIPD